MSLFFPLNQYLSMCAIYIRYKILEENVHNKLAHTAEHAFIGSLQKLVGKTLNVRKVEHREADNSVFITIPYLDLDLIIKAQSEANFLISMGRKVVTHSFVSLIEAKKRFPYLRANEERIKGESNSIIRVIEIEDHDIAACAMEHADNLKECDFFLIRKISKSGNEYEINFVVEKQAKETAIALSLKLLSICKEVGANFNTIENTIRKLKADNEIYLRKLKKLTKEKLDNIIPYTIGHNKITIIQGIFSGLIDSEVCSFASRKTTEYNNTVVLIANINHESEDTPAQVSIVFARNESSLVSIDCNKLFREISGKDGRGGGKPHFVTGIVNKERVADILNNIVDAINDHNF
jgi:alanyl-tRNA synthetase